MNEKKGPEIAAGAGTRGSTPEHSLNLGLFTAPSLCTCLTARLIVHLTVGLSPVLYSSLSPLSLSLSPFRLSLSLSLFSRCLLVSLSHTRITTHSARKNASGSTRGQNTTPPLFDAAPVIGCTNKMLLDILRGKRATFDCPAPEPGSNSSGVQAAGHLCVQQSKYVKT